MTNTKEAEGQSRWIDGLGIAIGDRVRTGVYVIGEWRPMWLGIVVDQSEDGTISKVDTGSMHGCAPRLCWEQTSHLRAEPNVKLRGDALL